MDTDALRARIRDDLPRVVDELSRLVAIDSIAHAGYEPARVRESAELTRDLLAEAGADARLLEMTDGPPAVFAERPGAANGPTVLLYAHHDVQPAATPDGWTTPPFDPQVRDGRLYGRGAADDKSGIVTHAAALRALAGEELPCRVTVVVEGEEEYSTEHLPELVRGNAELLRADVALIADGGNVRTGEPTIGTSVRGAHQLDVRVDVLPAAQHSGGFGGPLPDAAMSLARMIASLHDDRGDVAVGGLRSFVWDGTPVEEDEFRAETGVFPEVELIGSGTLADRTLSKPSINVLAFEAPRMHEVANQIVPTASAAIGVRLAPGEDGPAAIAKVAAHLRAAAPWGVRVTIDGEDETPGDGYLVDTGTEAYRLAEGTLREAFGADEVAAVGSGGSIPLVAMLADTFPGIAVLITGAGDDRSNYHSVDESVDLGDLERMIVFEALFLTRFGAAT
jgi:acetylornithine deacetylase/succinyl-diaminopimelate desuccinylase-like protein